MQADAGEMDRLEVPQIDKTIQSSCRLTCFPAKTGRWPTGGPSSCTDFANPDPNAGFRDVIAELCRVARAAVFGIVLDGNL